MGRTFFTFSSGILLGFAAGIMMDKEKREKIQELAKSQSERIKTYEQTLKNSIDKIKKMVEDKNIKASKK